MNWLKKSFLYGITMLVSLGTLASSYNNNTFTEKDTVILKFGNNSQIVVYVDSKEDLKELTQYDINKILEDLNMQLNNLNDSVQVLEIKDETGDKYLKDTVIVYQVEPRTESYDNDWDDGDNWDEDDEKSEEKKYRYYPRSRFDFIFDVGLNNWLEDGKFPAGSELYSVNPLASWYWNFGPTYKTQIGGPVFLDLGLTFACNVYRYNNSATRMYTDDSGLRFEEDMATTGYKKSKFSTWFVMGKVVPMFALGSNHRRGWRLWNNIDKGFRIGAGMYGGYRLASETKTKSDQGKATQTDHYLSNDIRYGVRGQLGFQGVDFFFEYDLSPVFQENQGAPDLSRIQFGISF